jgi:small subunit ribosomal protein S8e
LAFRGKRAYEMGNDPTATIVGEGKLRKREGRGGSAKIGLLTWGHANVTDPATGKTQKVEIKRVTRNPANPDYQRRGVITKGALIETSLGQAKVVSRPGQDGTINAVLTQKA